MNLPKMKTTKFLSIIAMLVILLGTAVTFSSCNEYDDFNKERRMAAPLVGKWVGRIDNADGGFKASLELIYNGTYVGTSETVASSYSGTWKVNEDETVTLTNFFDTTFSYEVSSNILKFSGNSWTAVFSRVPQTYK